jgi:hypothetical protein
MIKMKEETKGVAEIGWGNKFSMLAGSSTSVSVGSKHSVDISASNSIRFGIKNNIEWGPAFSYYAGPDFQKAKKYLPNTAGGFGSADSSFGQKMNWINSKIDFSEIKEHKFSISKEGSTTTTTTNKLLSEKGFTAGAGFGTLAELGYNTYNKTLQKTSRIMVATTTLPILVSLLQNLFSGPGSKDGPNPEVTLNSYAGMAINIGATIGPALFGLYSAIQAIAARQGFTNAIKPKAVIDLNKEHGLFIGTDHSALLNSSANGLRMNSDGTSLGLSEPGIEYPFSAVSKGEGDAKNELKYARLTNDPISALNLGKARGNFYIANNAPQVLLQAKATAQSTTAIANTLAAQSADNGDIVILADKDATVQAKKIKLTDKLASDTQILIDATANDKVIKIQLEANKFITINKDSILIKSGYESWISVGEKEVRLKQGMSSIYIKDNTIHLHSGSGSKLSVSSKVISLSGSNLKVLA